MATWSSTGAGAPPGRPGRRGPDRRGFGIRSLRSPGSLVLIAVMALLSAAMWVGWPLGVLWIAASLVENERAGLGTYLVVLLGLPLGMAALGRILAVVERAHARHLGVRESAPLRTIWCRSICRDRPRSGRRSLLDRVMAASAIAGLAALALWSVLFAGSPIPS